LLADQLAGLVQHLARSAYKAGQNRTEPSSYLFRINRSEPVWWTTCRIDPVAPVLLTQNQLGR
jgi:hypothetical protein